MGTLCTRFISDDCSPGTIFSGLAGPVRRRLPRRREDSATKTTARQGNPKGAIKRIDKISRPLRRHRQSTIERGVPPAGHTSNKAITRPPLQPSNDDNKPETRTMLQVPRVPAILIRNRAATNKVGDYCTTKGASRRRTCPTTLPHRAYLRCLIQSYK